MTVSLPVKEDAKSVKLADRVKREQAIQQVLGYTSSSNGVYLYDTGKNFRALGVVASTNLDKNEVQVNGYIKEKLKVNLFKANENDLLNYIATTYDEKPVDTSNLSQLTSLNYQISSNDSANNLPLPLKDKEEGIWYVQIKGQKTEWGFYYIRSGINTVAVEENNKVLTWTSSLLTNRSVTSGKVFFYNLENGIKELGASTIEKNGTSETPVNPLADVALVRVENSVALLPIRLYALNAFDSYWNDLATLQKVERKYYIFTDRPIYKPGDKIYFKAIVRDDDDAHYSIPEGTADVNIPDYVNGKTVDIFRKTYTISKDGTVEGEIDLPKDAVGSYVVNISVPKQGDQSPTHGYAFFDVQEYRKPEFSIETSLDKREVIRGEKVKATISGTYFSGQPLQNQQVKYSVKSTNYYEYNYFGDYKAYKKDVNEDTMLGYYYGDEVVLEGKTYLNSAGTAEISIPANTDTKSLGKDKVFVVKVETVGGSAPSYAAKNLLVRAGKFNFFRNDQTYSYKVDEQIKLPLIIAKNTETDVDNVEFTTHILREYWVKQQNQNSKYPTYDKKLADLGSVKAKSDKEGKADIVFIPRNPGYHLLTITTYDEDKNPIIKEFTINVIKPDEVVQTNYGASGIQVTTDKSAYDIGEKAKLLITSTIPNRDILLSMERAHSNQHQIVSLQGKSATIEIPLTESDMPNVYADVRTFSQTAYEEDSISLPVVTTSKDVKVGVEFDRKKYGAGETAKVKITTKDTNGKGISANVTLWSVDKAIYELAHNNVENIKESFWATRGNDTSTKHSLMGIYQDLGGGGGCFLSGTKVLMADGSEKNIEDIRVGEYVMSRADTDSTLVKAKVTSLHKAQSSDYLIINGGLKVTANHYTFVNGGWEQAGSIQTNDILLNSENQKIKVFSVEHLVGSKDVYNLEIERYHTYFANGIYVHNQKGGGVGRSIFKDTAYWNPNITTNENGEAEISMVLPDNLTTWVVNAIASTSDTKVGQVSKDLLVTKDVIVRPILPNLLRIGDTAILPLLVQNFTESKKLFDVSMVFEGVKTLTSNFTKQEIDASTAKTFSWKVKAEKEHPQSKISFEAKTDIAKESDKINLTLPIEPYQFHDIKGASGIGDKDFALNIPLDTDVKKSTFVLSLSSSITNSLPSSMYYLLRYPYGCVEQTTSRMVPALLSIKYPKLFTSVLFGEEKSETIIKKSLDRLRELQATNGGFAWWENGSAPSPFVTAYVIDQLTALKRLGKLSETDNYILYNAINFIRTVGNSIDSNNQFKTISLEERVAFNYGVSFDRGNAIPFFLTQEELGQLTPDLIALYAIGSINNNRLDTFTNGINRLKETAQIQGDSMYWAAGSKKNFGSIDVSTALAVRALMLQGGNQDMVEKGVRYLTHSRVYDYWSNTYATSQVLQTLSEYALLTNENTPNYTYSVMLNGTKVKEGDVNSNDPITDIKIPIENPDELTLSVRIRGEGQLYSTLRTDALRTDRKAEAVANGIQITREYIGEKGEGSTIGVGDLVTVRFKVSGLKTEESYGIIDDQLPAGLVAVNTRLKNETLSGQAPSYSTNYVGETITKDGIELSLYTVKAGVNTYEYKARAVVEGEFSAPPATVSLMYTPEIYGRTTGDSVKIDKESKAGKKSGLVSRLSLIPSLTILLVLLVGTFIFLKTRDKRHGMTSPNQDTNSSVDNT